MLLGGVGGGSGALLCAVHPECLSGLQSVGVPPFADKTWVGMSALSWAVFNTHMCLQAESAVAALMQLREVLFLWGMLDP